MSWVLKTFYILRKILKDALKLWNKLEKSKMSRLSVPPKNIGLKYQTDRQKLEEKSSRESSIPEQSQTTPKKSTTWCWPCGPKEFLGPLKYTQETLPRIPTGSLYFASRKGPVSEMNALITKSPYDMIGIVFQSRVQGKEGTYVYTLFLDERSSSIGAVDLEKLLSDPNIIHHAILPLKDFDIYDVKDENAENPNDVYSKCKDSKEWKMNLREDRNRILRDLFKKYRDTKPEYDMYQNVASLIGLSAVSNRSEKSFTPSELVGLILFEAGLIWDDRFATGAQNPAQCFDSKFFEGLAEKEQDEDESCATVVLTTPHDYSIERGNQAIIIYRKEDGHRHVERSSNFLYEDEETRESPVVSTSQPRSDPSLELTSMESESNSDPGPNLKAYLANTFNSEKGNNEKSGTVYSQDEDCEYQKCYHSNRNRSQELEDIRGWFRPSQKAIYAKTLNFSSLRPVDLLRDYYDNVGLPQKSRPVQSFDSKKTSGQLVSVVHSLYVRCCEMGIQSEINKLNLSWFHNELIPLELARNRHVTIEEEEGNIRALKEVVQELDQDFLQKRLLHQNTICMTATKLHTICKQLSETSSELHSLANECDTIVKFRNHEAHVDNWKNDDDDLHEVQFKVKLDDERGWEHTKEYELVLHEYMWGTGWKYVWKAPLKCAPDKYYEIATRIRKLLKEFNGLKGRTPNTCVLLEIIMAMSEQANRLNDFIVISRDDCCKPIRKRQ